MLVIRREQFAVLGSVAEQRSVELLAGHVRRCFPVDHALMGETGTLRFVRVGMERARARGFHTRGHASRWIDLALAFGSHFDRDPLLPWACAVLDNPRLSGPDVRMDRLEHCALRQLARVAGDDGSAYLHALLRARYTQLEDLTCTGDLLPHLTRLCQRIHPELARTVDHRSFAAFAQAATAERTRLGLDADEGALVMPLLQLLLGTFAVEDPAHAFIAETLAENATADAATRNRALLERGHARLDRAVELMPAREGISA